jgi:hypothetical protein
MPATSDLPGQAIVVLVRRGHQRRFDIATIARGLERRHRGQWPLRIMFDWSELRSWPFSPPSDEGLDAWRRAIPPISHAAIVRDRKWNRHAAILGALFWIGDTRVECFGPSERPKAFHWLARGPQTSDPDEFNRVRADLEQGEH